MSPPGAGAPRLEPPLRVLVVSKSLATGGAERLLVDVVAAGDPARCHYEVAGIREDARQLEGELRAHGVPVHALGARHNLDPTWIPRLRRVLGAGRYDVVHFHLPYAAALGRPVVASLVRGHRPATVYTEHSIWTKVSPGIRALNHLTVARDAAVVAVSGAAYDALPGAARRRATVLEHGIDLAPSDELVADRDAVRSSVRAELDVRDGEVLAVTVAGLRKEKGHDVLLDAAALVAARGLPVRFAVAGSGALADELAARRRELGLDGVVTYLGHRDDALRLLAAADLMVLPSRQEGLPVTLMEATSVGTPVVASAVGGVPQVVSDGHTGLLVPPGRADALADAVARLAGDPELRARLGSAAAAERERFDVRRAAAALEELYRSVVAGRPGRGLNR